MNNNLIVDLFYKEIVKEVNESQTVTIDNSVFHFPFFIETGQSDNIPGDNVPVLQIKDKETFDILLTEYIYKYESFINSSGKLKELLPACCGSIKPKEILKYLLAVLWQNATEEDFKNPLSYLRTRNQFIDSYEKLENIEILATLDDEKEYYISSKICKQLPSLETPYYLQSTIYHYDEQGILETYSLPRISFGLADNKAYIYSIQTKKFSENIVSSFDKKINRYLYKANEKVIESEEYLEYKNKDSNYYPENISDISVNTLYSLVMLLKLFQNLEIKEIECVNYLPLRYLSKKKSNDSKNNIFHNLYNNLGIDFEEVDDTIDFNQHNITDKFIRTFMRFSYHFPEVSITAYPFEQGSNLKLSIDNEKAEKSNHILNRLLDTAQIEFNEKSR